MQACQSLQVFKREILARSNFLKTAIHISWVTKKILIFVTSKIQLSSF